MEPFYQPQPLMQVHLGQALPSLYCETLQDGTNRRQEDHLNHLPYSLQC